MRSAAGASAKSAGGMDRTKAKTAISSPWTIWRGATASDGGRGLRISPAPLRGPGGRLTAQVPLLDPRDSRFARLIWTLARHRPRRRGRSWAQRLGRPQRPLTLADDALVVTLGGAHADGRPPRGGGLGRRNEAGRGGREGAAQSLR